MLRARVRRHRWPASKGLIAKADLWAKTMRLRRTPRLRMTDAVKTPAVMGMFRAEILLPPTLADSLRPDELRMVMLHEMGHVKRHDLLFHWLSLVLLAVHWFNPLCWLAALLYRADREAACDATVLRACSHDARSLYGHTLLKLEASTAAGLGLPSLVGVLGSVEMLRSRIIEIARFGRGSKWAGGLAMVAVAACAVGLAAVAAEPPTQKVVVRSGEDKTADGMMLTRIYKVPPDFVKISSNTPPDKPEAAKELFTERGVAFPEGASATYVKATSQLVVKNTAANLKDVERLVGTLLANLENKHRQVYMSTTMVVFDKSMLGKGIGIVPGEDKTLQMATTSPARLSMVGVLTDPQYQAVFRKLRQDQKVKAVLTLPSVTTRSEEKATVEVVREYRYATEYEPAAGGADAKPTAFANRDVGFKMEVEPVISEGGYTLDLSISPTICTYLKTNRFGKGVEQPVFDTTSVSTAVRIPNGQTIELAGEIPLSNFLLDPEAKTIAPPPSEKYPVLLFITAALIDPTGQPVNKPAAKATSSPAKKLPPTTPVRAQPLPAATGVEMSAVYFDITSKAGENQLSGLPGVILPPSNDAPTAKPPQDGEKAARTIDLARTARLGTLALTGVLTDAQAKESIAALRKRSGVTMRAFDVQTLSAREAKMELALGDALKGRKIAIKPSVGPDDHTVDLEIAIPTADSDKADILTSITVWDGQTTVLGGLVSEDGKSIRNVALFISSKIIRAPATK